MSTAAERAKSVFLRAVEAPSEEERRAYLDATCGGDDALRREVEGLLDHHRLLQTHAVANPDFDGKVTSTIEDGRVTGHYEVLQVLGTGGFGIVVRAFDEVLRRVVAIKVLSALFVMVEGEPRGTRRRSPPRTARLSSRWAGRGLLCGHAVRPSQSPASVSGIGRLTTRCTRPGPQDWVQDITAYQRPRRVSMSVPPLDYTGDNGNRSLEGGLS
jgi:hypothetical protein